MRHKEFRPRAPARATFRQPRATRRRLRVWVIGVAGLIVVAAVAYAAIQLLRPVPVLTLASAPPPSRTLPGSPPRPAWPGQGQAAIGLAGTGQLAADGGGQPQAIASLAKIMTAYIVLRDHPLPPGDAGPGIAVHPADVTTYAADLQQGQSAVKVTAGETLSERQALEAMLIPSGNNIATLLASWDAGSPAAFVARMNAEARSLGLDGTRYADASGANPATQSTAADQLRLTLRALQIPAFAQIVAMRQVTLPVAGVAYNVNSALGHDGIVGVKTGSSSLSGGCLAFAALRPVAGTQATIVGVLLGVRPTAAQPSELAGVISASERLLGSVSPDVQHVQVMPRGTVLGHVNSAWSTGPSAVTAAGVSVTGWSGTPATVTVVPLPLADRLSDGQPVARAMVTAGGQGGSVPVTATGAVQPPSLGWRLTRL
jgi:serine-type D-Ala-D-Ala carboxypeptidase (penicillin-binding protein 5/6)